MLYKVQSGDTGLVSLGFFNDITGAVDVSILSQSSTKITLFNSSTNVTTEVNGFGLTLDQGGSPTSGTVTSLVMTSGGAPVGEISNLSWGLVTFDNALEGLENDDYAPLAALLNLQPITFDLRDATADMDFESVFWPVVSLITQPVTVYGSPHYDNLVGGAGSDTIFFAGNPEGTFVHDYYFATPGDDTLNFTGVSNGTSVSVDYEPFLLMARLT